MTGPDFRHGYLRLPFAVWRDVFCRAPVSRRQLQLISLVIRESWGWQTPTGDVRLWTRPLSPGYFAQATGLSTDHLRRDLQDLIDRGILQEQRQTYHFVANPQMWITPRPAPLDPRPMPPEPPLVAAESAPAPPGVKIGKISNRNPLPPVQAGDNSSSAPQGTLFARFGRSRDVEDPPAVDRLADIVGTFVGSLDASQAEALRAWVCAAGIASVWSALEPAFREGPLAARARLDALLRDRASSPLAADDSDPEKERDDSAPPA